MSIRSQFFDSSGGDRIYTANDFSAHLAAIYSDGIIPENDSDALKVLQSVVPAKSVRVSLGKCFIQGRFVEIFNASETLTVPDNLTGANRFDSVKVRINFLQRTGELFYHVGDNISQPGPTRDGTFWELILARVTVAHGFTQVLQANILDQRNDIFFCGKSKPTTLRQNFQNVPGAGWKRIAVSNGFFQTLEPQAGNIAHANFVIRSINTTSGQFDHMNIIASAENGNVVLECHGRSRNNAGRNFDGVRIVHDPTFADGRVALEVNVTTGNAFVFYEIYNNYSPNGWFPLNWTAGSVPGGYAECKLDFTLVDMVYGIATAQELINAYTIDREGEIRTRGTPQNFRFTQNNVGLEGVQTDGTTVRNLIKLNNFNNTEIGSTARQSIVSSLGLGPQFFDGANIFQMHHDGYVLPNARMNRIGAAQSIPSGVVTVVDFDSERWDTHNLADPATDRITITAATDGFYQIFANISWTANTTGDRLLSVRLNGVTTIVSDRVDEADSAGITIRQNVSTVYKLAAGDFLEVVVFQSSGAGLTIEVTGNHSPEFGISFLSPS